VTFALTDLERGVELVGVEHLEHGHLAARAGQLGDRSLGIGIEAVADEDERPPLGQLRGVMTGACGEVGRARVLQVVELVRRDKLAGGDVRRVEILVEPDR